MEQQALLAAAVAASSSSMNVDSLIQSALAAGIPPLQVVQFVQQRQALQQQNALSAASSALQHQQLSAIQTPAGSTSSTTGAAQSHATLGGFSLNNISAILAAQQQQAAQSQQSATAAQQQAQQMAAVLHQAQQAQQQAAAQQTLQNQQQHTVVANAQSGEANSLPWPIFQPTVNVPFFDMSTYQKVNLDVQASALPSGMDLPLQDMPTLRFFFNFGVHHARAILLREHFHIATPNGQQQGATGAQTQLGQTQQHQGQSQQSAALLSLQQQDPSLYQQALLKATPEALANANANKQIGGSLPGSTSAATDPNAVFQLQRDLSTSISINQLQNTLAQMNKMGGQAGIGQAGIAGNFKNDQIEALLMQNSMLNQQSQGMQFRVQNASVNQGQQQTQPEGLHRPTAIMPSSMPLGLNAAKVAQQGHIQQGQQQLLGGLGISASIQQQVPVDPAPRVAAVGKPVTSEQLVAAAIGKPGVANPVPLTSSVLASFLQEQQSTDRMKPTSLVRGAVTDVARPVVSVPASSASPIAPQNIANVTASTTIAAPVPSTAANGGMSLAAQLSLAMMNGAYFQEQKQRIDNATATKAPGSDKPLPAGLNVSSDNPDAHLLAATSPFVKLMGTTAAATRSLTAGTSANPQAESNVQVATTSAAAQPGALTTASAQQPASTTAPSATHPYLLGPFGGADLDPTTFLAATELNYTEAFRRSHDQRDSGTPENQRRKSGIYMLPGGNGGAESKEDPANKKKISTDKPIGPTMINYVNSCLNQLKSQVQSHGVGLNVDANFRPIDYSSRPIDDIFRKAREQLDRERDLTQHRASVSPALLHRLHAGNNPASAGHEEQLGRSREDGSGDGSSSAPATAPAIVSQTEIPVATENGGRSKSEQPADTKPTPEIKPESAENIPSTEETAPANEETDDGAPDAKRAKIEETTEPKADNAEAIPSSP